MRLSVDPQRVELSENHSFTVNITVTNTGAVIGGYRLRILGADPSWVKLEADDLSLFPDTSQTVAATIELPPGVGAGDRRIAVQVRELTPPQAMAVAEIELMVPPREAIDMKLSPMTVTCGKRGRFSVLADNTGNTPISVAPVGLDAEDKIAFEFVPSELNLAPGENVIVDLRAKAKRRWFGTPVVRPFSVATVPPEERADFVAAHEPKARRKANKDAKRRATAQKKADNKQANRLERDAKRQAKQARKDAKELERREARSDTEGFWLNAESERRSAGSSAGAAGDGGGLTAGSAWPGAWSGAGSAADTAIGPNSGAAGEFDSTAAEPAEPPPEPPEPLAQGVIVQKPKLGRGLLSLLSLLLAVSVFAVVITIAMSRLVSVSAADRDLAIQVASARTDGAGSGSSVVGGTVKRLTDGSVVPGVTVEVFAAGDLTQPMISTATDDSGAWSVLSMPAGSYKIRFRSDGFAEVWYPNALAGADAKAVELADGQKVSDLAVALGGLPATISGTVTGDDVTGAVLTVEVPQEFLQPVDEGNDTSAGTSPGTAPPAVGGGAATVSDSNSNGADVADRTQTADGANAGDSADGGDTGDTGDPADADDTDTGPAGALTGGVLRTIPIGSDGSFTLDDLPSPAVYNLVVSKPGFATASQPVDLSGGEARTGITLLLRTGDGLISGTVNGPDGPLGGATITATSGKTTVTTLALTKDPVGGFTLRGLVTPATYTVSVTAPGYTTVTSTLALTAKQKLTGVVMSLARSSASLSGIVTTLSDGEPAPGVTVSISSGTSDKLTTVTQSGDTAGQWTVAGLPIPGTYTITFSREDLQPQTVAVALNSAGTVTSGADGSNNINATMKSAFATVSGTIQQQTGSDTQPVGEATITLSSGEQTYTVTSASTPADLLGRYEVGHVAPGTYTVAISRKGTSPTTVIISVTAGQILPYNPVLIQPASVAGTVTEDDTPLPGVEVDMYLASQYPAKVYRQTTTGADGSYSFTGVDAPQAYVIEVHSPTAGSLASDTIVLDASQAGVLNLAVQSSATMPPSPSTSTSTSPPGTP